MDNKEQLNFKISTGLKNIIGKELITSEVVAVFELVKNSFDASAKKISIEINLQNDSITILDDGIGMTKDDIKNKWLFVAYSEKKDIQESNGRKYVGAKGIGRFACDRLGKDIEIVTKTKLENTYNVLNINWDEFEKNSIDEFKNIPVYYSKENSNELIIQQGTLIKIKKLRDNWDYDRIIKLKKSLEKLVNPFMRQIDMEINLTIISEDEKSNKLSGKIQNSLFDALKEKTVFLKAVFNDNIKVELNDRGNNIYNIEKKINDTGLDGITICIYYLNTVAKNNFTRIMGVEAKNYGSIFFYKNDFRVYPYGELNYDTLGLDSRKTQGHSRYIGNRELVGYISIVDPKNRFIEVSSRDRGFIENAYYKILEELYMEYAHKPLEKYVNLIKWGYADNQEITYSDIQISDKKDILPTFVKNGNFDIKINNEILDKISLSIEQQLVNARNNKNLTLEESKELLKKSQEYIKDSQKIIQSQNEKSSKDSKIITQLENQNSLLKNLTNEDKVLQAEVTHHISKMSNELDSCIENIVDIYENGNKREILEELSKIKLISDKMRVFNEVILKGNFKSKGKIRINIFDYFKFYFDNSRYIRNQASNKKIVVTIDEKSLHEDWVRDVDVYDISVIIDNMVSNAMDLNAKIIDVRFSSNNKINFFSDTPTISEENKSRIFELGFSTKIGGTGIGLYQIDKIIKKYGWKIEVENKDNGVEFIIEVR